MLDERAVTQLADRLLQLALCIHDDWSVPGDRLLDRLARDEQEADAIVAGLHGGLVTRIEHHQRTIAGPLAHQRLARGRLLFGEHAERLRCTGEGAGAFEYI